MSYSQGNLISCIYDMSLRHATWDSILDILSASLPGCLILLSGDDLAKRTNIVFAQRGLSPAAANAYATRYAPLNPWLAALAAAAPSQVFQDDQLRARQQAHASPFYAEWLAAQGDFGAATGLVLLREGSRQLTLEVRYSADDQMGLRDRATALLGDAASHFRRAFEISSRSRLSAGPGYLDGVVEDLPFAVFFVDTEMRIRYSNFHAEGLRRHGHGPFSSADGILRANTAETDAALRQLVQRAIGSKRAPTAVLQIGTPDSDHRHFAIARLAARNNQPYQLHDAILDPGPLVMLIVHGSDEAASLPADLLWRAFSLTDSEANLAEALLNGETLADFARERAVSKQTLRNQLVGVMRKTGTRRQSELVALLTRLSLTCF
jgi:DNA-binding CsgD family transcriptional regulator